MSMNVRSVQKRDLT